MYYTFKDSWPWLWLSYVRLFYCQFSASCYWIISLPYFINIWGSWWKTRWAWWAVCPPSKEGTSSRGKISGVQSAGGERQLFCSIQKLGACEELSNPGLPTANKKDIDILQVSHTEGCKEGSGTHCMRGYWDAEGNVCSVWKNQDRLLSPAG